MGETLNAFYLPGVGPVEGRPPTIDEYELALAFLRSQFGNEPVGTPRVLIGNIETILRRRRWADANQRKSDGNEDGDKLDGGHMESDPGMLEGE